jgi:O-antigen ligase
VIFGLLFAEAALFIAGALLGRPFLGVAAVAALVFFLIAYRSPKIAWALVWVAFPFSLEMSLPGGNAIYVPTEPMMILSILAWALRAPADGRLQIPRSRVHAPLVALALVALASVALSRFPLLGFKAWIAAVAYAAFGYGFCFLNLRSQDFKQWVPWVVGPAGFWGLYGAIRVLLAGVSATHAYGAARPYFPEHGTYSAYLAMTFPLAFFAALESRGRERMLYAAGGLAIALGITLSFTRAAWVSLVLVIPLAASVWAVRRRTIRPLAWAGGLALLIGIAVAGLGAERGITRHAESVVETDNVSNLERVNRWMAAAEMARKRPLLGVGYGIYPAEYPEYRRKLVLTDQAYFHMGAHSEPLRVLSETGVAGVGVALWLLGAVLLTGIRAFRSIDERESWVVLAVLAGLGTYLIHSVFNSYPGVDKVTIPFWASVGMLAGVGRSRRPTSS